MYLLGSIKSGFSNLVLLPTPKEKPLRLKVEGMS